MGYHNNQRINRKQKIITYFEEQHGRCAYCFNEMTLLNNKPNSAQVEHVLPQSKFKKLDSYFNEVAACATCNTTKADKPLRVFLASVIYRRTHGYE